MSATGRTASRIEHDRYNTPEWCVDRLLEMARLPSGGAWLEPCVGDGAIVRAVSKTRPDVRWFLGEIVPDGAPPSTSIVDAAIGLPEDYGYQGGRFKVLITNPPYRLSTSMVMHWVTHRIARVVVVLLRVNWLASAKRQKFLQMHPPDVYVLPNRPSFTGGGTDATDYAWMVWDERSFTDTGRICVLNPTPLEERQA